MNKIGLSLLFLLLILSCKNSENRVNTLPQIKDETQTLDSFNWLLGNWIIENGEEYSRESWRREDNGNYSAYSFTRIGADTVFSENILLWQKEGRVLFTVSDAKKPLDTISFHLIEMENEIYVFENKDNDFPQRIVYSHPTPDSIYAWIEGTVNGKNQKIDFSFIREK